MVFYLQLFLTWHFESWMRETISCFLGSCNQKRLEWTRSGLHNQLLKSKSMEPVETWSVCSAGNSTNSGLLSFRSLGILWGISQQKAFFKVNQKFFNELTYVHNPRTSISGLQHNIPNCILMSSLNATLPTQELGEILLKGIDCNDIPNRNNVAAGFKHLISLYSAIFA